MRVRRPRVLQVLFSFQVGGSEIFALELARHLAARGAEVLCGALDGAPGPILARCEAYGIRAVDLRISTTNPLTRNGISLRLARELRDLRLDAIHLQHFLGLNKLGLPATLAGIRRIVVTEHSRFDVSQSLAGRLRTRLNWRMASAITVVHSDIRDYLCGELGLPEERVTVIPLGVDVESYDRRDREAWRSKLGLASDELAFVFVGRLAPVKNVPGLISAFLTAIARQRRAARLLIVGDGADRASCEALIRAHPHGSKVSLIGEQPDSRPYLAAGDVFVMNSLSEGTPRALLEAMASGLSAICTAVGGVPDILAEGRGRLTRADDQASLQEAFAAALDDPTFLVAQGAKNRAYVRAHYDVSSVVERYQRLLLG